MAFFQKQKAVDIITNEVITNNKNTVKIGKRILKTIKVQLCEMCYMPSKKTIVCGGKNCKRILCKGCITYINNIPFCNDCIVEIVREKSVLIITKP